LIYLHARKEILATELKNPEKARFFLSFGIMIQEVIFFEWRFYWSFKLWIWAISSTITSGWPWPNSYGIWLLIGGSWVQTSDGSGSKIFDLGRVGSAIYGLGLNLENFP